MPRPLEHYRDSAKPLSTSKETHEMLFRLCLDASLTSPQIHYVRSQNKSVTTQQKRIDEPSSSTTRK